MPREKDLSTLGQKLFDQAIARLNVSNAIAVSAIQSLLILNGGAIISILGFLSQGKESELTKHLYIPTIITSIVLFAIGCTFTLASAIMGYWSQSTFATNENVHAWRVLEYGTTDITAKEDQENSLGNSVLNYAFLAAIAGLISFVSGCGIAAWAFIAASA